MTLTFLQPPPELTGWKALTAAQKTEQVRGQVELNHLSYGQAAAILGTTRVAVAGVVERAKRSASPIMSTNRPGFPPSLRKAKSKAKTDKPKRAPRLGSFQRLPSEIPIPGDTEIITADAVWAALPGSSPVPIAEHQEGMCRWPCGQDSPFTFCGLAVDAGGPYCGQHSTMAFREAPPLKLPTRKNPR